MDPQQFVQQIKDDQFPESKTDNRLQIFPKLSSTMPVSRPIDKDHQPEEVHQRHQHHGNRGSKVLIQADFVVSKVNRALHRAVAYYHVDDKTDARAGILLFRNRF